jgi:cold shock protein
MTSNVVGVCRAFDSEDGWGWLSVEGEDDVWVHFSAIQMTGFRALSLGQKVLFDLEENPSLKEQSRRAVNVRLLPQDE